jgi:hypothetical protein
MRQLLDRRRFTMTAAVIAASTLWPLLAHSEAAAQPKRLTGLLVTKAQRTMADGKNGIEITFDNPSAERVRQFTSGAAALRVTVSVNQSKLGTLRLLGPLVDGNLLVTGQLDSQAVERLFSPDALVDLEIE